MMSSDARKLSPSKGGILTKKWFFIIIGAGVIFALIALSAFGTVDLSFFGSDAFIGGVLVMILTGLVAKMLFEAHYVDYAIETDFNSEVKLGKKKGEFSFNLEGKTFYGVDCGSIKIILLQGNVANHEKKIQTPSFSGKVFSLQSFQGKKINKMVLRAMPITNVDVIMRLGWQGFTEIEQKKNPSVVNNLRRLILSPEWSGVIWAAPYVPDEIYKQFMYNEKTLAEIETTYESKIDIIAKDSNNRITELKTYYLHVGSEMFQQSAEIIKTTIQSYEIAAGLVNYMLSKNPSEIQDTLAALNLEAGKDTLQNVIEKKVQELENLRETMNRVGAVIGLKNPEDEANKQQIRSIAERLQTTGSNVINKFNPRGRQQQEEGPILAQ